MINKNEIEELAIEYLYGEITDERKSRLMKLIDENPEYKPLIMESALITESIRVADVTMPAESDWNKCWNGIEKVVKPAHTGVFSGIFARLAGLFSFSSPAAKFAGALAMVIVGIFIGRNFFNGNNTVLTDVPGQAETALSDSDISETNIVELASGNVFKKTRLIMFEFINLDINSENKAKEIEYLQQSAKDLSAEVKDLRLLAEHNNLENMSKLFGIIEMALVEIQHIQDNEEQHNFQQLKKNIEDSDLLLKLRSQAIGV